MATERVQKILAQVGIASRRKAEDLIRDGVVTINGKVAKLGDQAEFGKDSIKVDGKLIHTKEAPMYVAFFKPKGVISMMADPEGRPTIAAYLSKVHARLFPIGRLDFNSEGLILLTNDGQFAEKLQKLNNVPRVYHIKVKGHPEPAMITRLEKGVRVGTRNVRPHSVRVAETLNNKTRIEVVVNEAGATDLKSLFDLKGFLVEKMVRTAIGHITLHGLLPGEYRLLKQSQVQALIDQPELGHKLLQHEQAKSAKVVAKEDRIRERVTRQSQFSGKRDSRGEVKPRRETRGAFASKREPREGGFAPRRETRAGGFAPKRDDRGAFAPKREPREGGFAPKRETRAGGFASKRDDRGAFAPKREPREGGFAPKRESRTGGFGSKRDDRGSFAPKREPRSGGFAPRRDERDGFKPKRGPRTSFGGKRDERGSGGGGDFKIRVKRKPSSRKPF